MTSEALPKRSIARKLIAAVLLLELLAALALIGLTIFYESHTHFRAFDVMLRGRADSLLGAVGDAEDPADNVMLDLSSVTVMRRDLYRVEEDGKGVLGQSKEWPAAELKDAYADQRGYLRVMVRGREYRFIELHGVRVVDPGDKNGGVRHAVTVRYGAPTGLVWHEVWEAVRFYTLASVVLLTVTGFVMAMFLRRGLAPLRELAEEAEKVSAQQWQFTTPASAGDTRELAPLGAAIEAALGRLQLSFEQQERFTSDAAHELKTDVAIVKSSIQLLGMKSRSAAEYRDGLEVCLKDCQRLEGTVQEMLTLARTQYASRQVSDAASVFDMSVAARETALRLASFAELRRVRVTLTAPDGMVVGLESKECELLCSNLFHNAVLHSPPASEVQVEVSRDGGSVSLRVEDSGEGITAEALPHVFEPFFRGDASRDRNSGGTGLGLAICKAICDKAGGSIGIESAVGVGTRVMVRLPFASST